MSDGALITLISLGVTLLFILGAVILMFVDEGAEAG